MIFNRNQLKVGFTEATVNLVWQKARIISGNNPAVWRKDACGAWINRTEYGNTNSQYGWEIDHIIPVSRCGTDAFVNLQPLQWENNRYKSDNYPIWSCKVKAA